ncbi:DUF4280 domain-containing protein [Pigmentibacter sp. JX0631]|uniref:DUF4280 domain-containing protein n=1 Tax=Pigmentibacter sp. JX0631 TaxID=2976982 RepID=UPI002468DBB4|nr:DUF4280 domain-containing protein [Pigmentibacter sp. JX0631]WGL60332.1 DUF4280 domain-containing protein [Pigmentibacter sp. JX0631]
MPCPLTCTAGQMQCSFGMTPAVFNALPDSMVFMPTPAGKIMDNLPMVNIPPFGMCQSPANPMVVALTAAALGVFTPAPCIPAITAPWLTTSPTVLMGGKPALDINSKGICMWGGLISFLNSGQTQIL